MGWAHREYSQGPAQDNRPSKVPRIFLAVTSFLASRPCRLLQEASLTTSAYWLLFPGSPAHRLHPSTVHIPALVVLRLLVAKGGPHKVRTQSPSPRCCL